MFVSDHLMAALTQLVKAELAFTSQTEPDGRKIYVVDFVSLTEEELILLHRRGALTRDGIRHYLVDRAA